MLSVIIGGKTYSLDDGTYCRFIGHDGLGSPDVRRFHTRGAMQHGVSDTDFRLDPRTFTLVLEIEGISLNNYYQKREALLNLLRVTPSGSPLTFKFTIHEDRYIDAYFVGEGKMGWQDKDGFTQRANFVFYAPRPLFYSQTPGSAVIDLGGGSGAFTIPTDIPTDIGTSDADVSSSITYAGSFQTHPHRIRIHGPITDPVVTNLSTGEKLDFTGTTITLGDYFDVDTRYGTQSVVDSGGVDRIANLTDDSDLATFHLGTTPEVPGGVNSIQVTGTAIGTTSAVEIYWTNYYLGI